MAAPEAWSALKGHDAERAASLFSQELTQRPRDPMLHFGAGSAAYALDLDGRARGVVGAEGARRRAGCIPLQPGIDTTTTRSDAPFRGRIRRVCVGSRWPRPRRGRR